MSEEKRTEELARLRADLTLTANALLTTVDTMRHEAAEAREIIEHRGEDECPGWLDRANALDEYASKIALALGPIADHLPAALRVAAAAPLPEGTQP